MKNIELKVEVDNFKDIIKILKNNQASEKGVLWQIDTYYNCKNRLKVREENNRKFQLVFYVRPDRKEAKVSDFDVVDFNNRQAQELKAVLKKAYGEKVVVKKERRLWIYKNTRIHLDKVEKLGLFLELETLVKKDITSAMKEYKEVAEFLNLDKYKKLKKSYSNLLMAL